MFNCFQKGTNLPITESTGLELGEQVTKQEF